MYNEYGFNNPINYIQNNSIDSIDDDFQPTGKYLTFNTKSNTIGMINLKVNIAKKNTKISSNIDEDVEIGNNINNNENQFSNILDINIHVPENSKSARKSGNDNDDNFNDKYYSHNSVTNMTNFIPTSNEEDNSNNIKKFISSENKKFKNDDVLHLKAKEESIDSNGKKAKKKLKPVSKNKSKKKALMILEEKNKYKSTKKSIFETAEKEEKKEDEKIIRRDKNGVPICKKNKRKVKISFERPFEIITPIESYKKYNTLLGMPGEGNFMNDKLGECQCCFLV